MFPLKAVLLAIWCVVASTVIRADIEQLKTISPKDGETLKTSLSAILRWEYPAFGAGFSPSSKVRLEVSLREDMSQPLITADLSENQTDFRLAVAPHTTYFWRVTPFEADVARTNRALHARFTSGDPTIDTTTDDRIRYRNPRRGAHWTGMRPVEFDQDESLSPWFERRSYLDSGLPTFDVLKPKLPIPIFDGHPDALDAYWYCWKTLRNVWYFTPDAPDHEAVANICGIKTWGSWGSTMVFDTAFILHFARYGQQAYPFITAYDNCYARQHENGFICRETDKNNREVYSGYPVNPPLFAWAEWEWFRLTGDTNRLREIFLPIVKHYEWYMTYQRRDNGLYWTSGLQEADDSPRNRLMHFAVSATSYQALAADRLARIAKTIGRSDLVPFFENEHRILGEIVNRRFWDDQHGIYNDLDVNEKFITELKPGTFCKHVHMFWPLLAGIVPPERVDRIIKELNNPASFNRRNGVPSLSADSAGYTGGPNGNGQYWCGAVWPSGELMIQEGLRTCGREQDWRSLAEKYFAAQLEIFDKEKTIKENMAPDIPLGCGVPEFVGWGGVGPIANLIEAVLGFDIDAPANTISWRINRLERHGLKNFTLNSVTADCICEARATTNAPCEISINSTGNFTLRLILAGISHEVKITPGEHHLHY